MSRVLGDDHSKRMPRVTVGVARWKALTTQWPWVLSIGQHLLPIIVTSPYEWTILEWDDKPQANIYVIRDLRDKIRKSLTSDISKTTNILRSIIFQKVFRIKFWTICTYCSCMVPLGSYKLQVRRLNLTCTDNSRTARNLWTVVVLGMYIKGHFLWYQAGSLNKGPRRIQSIWLISPELIMFF